MNNITRTYNIILNISQNWQNIAVIKESELYYLKSFFGFSYWNTIWFIIVALCITFIMLILATTLSLTIFKNQAQLTEYECGFEPFDNATRTPFEVHFYVVGILFLIFDVEIALLYPWLFSLQEYCISKFFLGYIFLSILALGFGYELKMNILKWKYENSLILDKEIISLKKKFWKQKSIFLFCGTTQHIRKGQPKEWYLDQSIGGGRRLLCRNPLQIRLNQATV